jgi:predicted nucleotidyltransferase
VQTLSRFASRRWPCSAQLLVATWAPESDVDMLVSFAGPATFDGYMDLKAFLEDLLGRSVDLVTSGALKPALRSRIASDLVHVA